MQKNKQAFTLIELLVVVLIIGILVTVALPQYKKAVVKSRYSTLKPLVKTLADAEEVYYIANGEYASSIEELDVSFPEPPTSTTLDLNGDKNYSFPWGTCSLMISVSVSRVYCHHSKADIGYGKVLRHPKAFKEYAGKQKCMVKNNSAAIQICQQESGLMEGNHPVAGNEPYSYYW